MRDSFLYLKNFVMKVQKETNQQNNNSEIIRADRKPINSFENHRSA